MFVCLANAVHEYTARVIQCDEEIEGAENDLAAHREFVHGARKPTPNDVRTWAKLPPLGQSHECENECEWCDEWAWDTEHALAAMRADYAETLPFAEKATKEFVAKRRALRARAIADLLMVSAAAPEQVTGR